MFDNLTTNKYLIIALAIALIVVLFLYNQKNICSTEKMDNINLNSKTMVEKPWTDDNDTEIYKKVDNDFDKRLDKAIMNQSSRNHLLKRKDQEFDDYITGKYKNDRIRSPIKRQKNKKYRCVCATSDDEFEFTLDRDQIY